jgi:flagellar basal body-associated protein FliL
MLIDVIDDILNFILGNGYDVTDVLFVIIIIMLFLLFKKRK